MEVDISIKVKPEWVWIGLMQSTARSYLVAQSFASRRIEHAVVAIGEAAEQFIALCIERNESSHYEIGFGRCEGAVHILFTYDASIPLNPHKEADYEVPDAEDDTLDDELTGLWLHIIKRTMDRVFFRLDGNRASLVLVLYPGQEGKAHQLWVMGLRPKLRPDLSLEFADDGQDPGAIIHDSHSRSVLQMSPSDAFIVSRMDGNTTMYDIYLEYAAERTPLPPAQIKRLYETLETAGMLDGTSGATETPLQRWNRRLSPIYSIPCPDALVTWAHRYARILINPPGVGILFLIGLSGSIPLFCNRADIRHVIDLLGDIFPAHPLLVAGVYAILLLQAGLHELAHGVTCKHFGGKVKGLGIMWYMAMFVFFCDTTSAWNFASKSQRIWVSLAGPLISWFFFGVMAWCAGLTAPTAGPQAALWTSLLLISAVVLAMYLNPLIRMDAYYMLVDWTGIPNLQKKAFSWLGAAISSRFRHASPAISPTDREKHIFTIYGSLSAITSFLFIGLPFYYLASLWMADRHDTPWGVISFIVIVLITGRLIFRAAIHFLEGRKKEHRIL